VVPANDACSNSNSSLGSSSTHPELENCLAQTDVLNPIITADSKQYYDNKISLNTVVSSSITKVGAVYSIDDPTTILGTCVLVGVNLVLMTCHAIEVRSMSTINVKFGYVTTYKEIDGTVTHEVAFSFKSGLLFVVEYNLDLDYAVICLKSDIVAPDYFKLKKEPAVGKIALLHHPLGQTLKVSVHDTRILDTVDGKRIQVYHDSNYSSSGGAYVNSSGELIAIHLGSELDSTNYNLLRYGLSIAQIIAHNSDSILAHIFDGTVNPLVSYVSECDELTLIDTSLRGFVMDVEGDAAKGILRQLIGAAVADSDPKLIKTADGKTVAINTDTISYIKDTYSGQYDECLELSLYRAGLHGSTNSYSIYNACESDHTVSTAIWLAVAKKDPTSRMADVVQNRIKDHCEHLFPAMTIPKEIHSKL
jgi:hypothetical protein